MEHWITNFTKVNKLETSVPKKVNPCWVPIAAQDLHVCQWSQSSSVRSEVLTLHSQRGRSDRRLGPSLQSRPVSSSSAWTECISCYRSVSLAPVSLHVKPLCYKTARGRASTPCHGHHLLQPVFLQYSKFGHQSQPWKREIYSSFKHCSLQTISLWVVLAAWLKC